jgi:mycobactin peptide synthetase MbtE
MTAGDTTAHEPGTLTVVSQTWAGLSGRYPAPDTHFIEAGGNSLMAGRLLARLARHTGRTVRVGDFLADPTPAALAALLAAASGPDLPEADPEQAPLTVAQQRLWVADQLASRPSPFVLAFEVALPAGTTRTRVQAAIDALTQRHPVLRATVDFDDDGDLAMTLDRQAPPAHITADGGQAGVNRSLRQLIQDLPPLDRSPGVRWVLVHADEDEVSLLFLLAHHVLIDGRSWEILVRELDQLLAGGKELSPAPPSFLSYALGRSRDPVRAAAATGRMQPVFALARRAAFTVPRHLLHPLDARCRELGVSRHVGLLTVLGVVGRPQAGVVGTVVADRPTAYDRTVGCFVRAAAVPADHARCTFASAAVLVGSSLVEAIRRPEASPSGGSDIVVNYAAPKEPTGLAWRELAPSHTKYRLRVDVQEERNGSLHVLFEGVQDPRDLGAGLDAALSRWVPGDDPWASLRPGEEPLPAASVEAHVLDIWKE